MFLPSQLLSTPLSSRPACAWRSGIRPRTALWAPGMMGTSWGRSPFMRKRRTARRQMGCYLAPAPAPGHQARRASGGNRLGPLSPKKQGVCLGPGWARSTELSCWRVSTRGERGFLQPPHTPDSRSHQGGSRVSGLRPGARPPPTLREATFREGGSNMSRRG